MLAKLGYLFLLISLWAGKVVIKLLLVLNKINPAKAKSQLAVLPYFFKGDYAYKNRFEEYDFVWQEQGIKYHYFNTYSSIYISNALKQGDFRRYILYAQIFWKRIFQVYACRNYKVVFYHRVLFPLYPDYSDPILERFLSKLGNKVIVDIWDSIWVTHKEITNKVVSMADVVTCVNQFIADYFEPHQNKKILFPIGINSEKYALKSNYNLSDPVKLFYTGSDGNVMEFLSLAAKPLNQLFEQGSLFELCVVSPNKPEFSGSFPIRHIPFGPDFYQNLKDFDIGLYTVHVDDIGKGKMATKVLDYLAAGLPSVIASVGISPFIENGEHCLFADNAEAIENNLQKMIDSHSLRTEIGKNGRLLIEQKHSKLSSIQPLLTYVNSALN